MVGQRFFFLGLIFLALFFQPNPAGAENAGFVSLKQSGYEIFHAPENPEPGQALVVALHLQDKKLGLVECRPLKMSFIKREFSLEPIAKGWRGVAAVPLGTKAGSYQLSVRLQGKDELFLTINVLARDYGEQRLTVPDEMVTPMRPENLQKIKQDRKKLRIAYASSGDSLLFTDVVRPPLSSTITSPFGLRRLFNGKPKAPHGGIDYKAAVGVPIVAAAKGRVVLAEELYYSGNLVIIDHGLDIFTLYMHLNKISCRPGDVVQPGQIVGTAGSSGRVTGPHLHWGVKVAGVFVDPLRFVDDSKHMLELPWEAENGKSKF
ncbi:MAG: M23 family metallopeptidase [Pseudomonadota bacterium]|nr:M23 family metallopeptidase [Pseudomonadota bacterium]